MHVFFIISATCGNKTSRSVLIGNLQRDFGVESIADLNIISCLEWVAKETANSRFAGKIVSIEKTMTRREYQDYLNEIELTDEQCDMLSSDDYEEPSEEPNDFWTNEY